MNKNSIVNVPYIAYEKEVESRKATVKIMGAIILFLIVAIVCVEEFIEEHPKGIYLITMEGHITVVIDGVLYDTFDCRPRRMWCAWLVER